MDLKQALQILNLNKNYTEEELKKAYRKLIIKYHPDKHPENRKEYAEQQTKIINEAKDILEKNLKNLNKKYNQTNNNTYNKHNQNYQNETNNEEFLKTLKKFKKEYTDEISTIEKIESIDKLFYKNKFYFISTLNKFLYRISISNDLKTIKKEYQNFRREYVSLLVNYFIEFEKISNINTNNYFVHYYDTLDEIRNLMYITVDKILTKELSKYEYNKYFQEISPIINGTKEGYVLVCIYGYDNIENIKKKFNNTIVYELQKYKKRKKLLEELESNKSFVTTNLNTIINLRENILSEKNFNNIYSQIDTFTKIKCKTRNLFKRK